MRFKQDLAKTNLHWIGERMTKVLIAAALTLTLFAISGAQQSTIEQRVTEAIENAKKGDQKSLALLKKDPELPKALTVLRRYLNDPNERVRSSVFALAEGVHTPEAISILSDLMKANPGRWGEAPVRAFYDKYDCKELLDGGGPGLRDNLIVFVKNEKNVSRAKAVLLLSCFKNDKDVVRTLESLDKGQHKTVTLDLSTRVDLALTVDLALAEIGNKQALDRFLQRLAKGEINDLVFSFRAIRFVNNKEVLAVLVEKVNDKRKAVYPWSDDFYLRISDLAVNALTKKAQQPLEIVVQNNYRYSDQELARAYELLKTNLPLK
jgi:HEAT repeat protein